MSLQDEMQEASEEYARRLERQRETDRLAALTLEARQAGNASAFALAFEEALTNREGTPEESE